MTDAPPYFIAHASRIDDQPFGAAGGSVHKPVAITNADASATGRQAGSTLEFTSDGRHPVHGHVSSGE